MFEGLVVAVGSRFTGVPEDRFREQFADLYPFARAVKDHQKSQLNTECWRIALDRAGAFKKVQGRRPSDTLLKALISWSAWSMSTSAIEQNFCKMERVFGGRLQSLMDSGLMDLLTVAIEHDAVVERDEMKAVLNLAQDLWLKHFGSIRAGTALGHRIDKGRKRPAVRNVKNVTETQFLKDRESDVRKRHAAWKEAGKAVGVKDRVQAESAANWTDAMDSEASLNCLAVCAASESLAGETST